MIIYWLYTVHAYILFTYSDPPMVDLSEFNIEQFFLAPVTRMKNEDEPDKFH